MNRYKSTLAEIRTNSAWNLSNGKYTLQELQSFFGILSFERNVHTIRLEWNANPDIARTIANPFFPALKSLCLGANNIYSLEGVAGLKAENLKELLLWNNKIVDLRALRKLRAPNLQHLDLSSNLIMEIGWLSQLSAKELKRINLDYNFLVNAEELGRIKNFNKGGHVLLLSNTLVTIFRQPAKQGQRIAMQLFLTNSRPEIKYS